MDATIKLSVTTTGGAGSATGNYTSTELITGFVQSVKVEYNGAAGTTNAILSENGSAYGRTILNRSATNTGGVFYPVIQNTDTLGAAVTGEYQRFFLQGTKLLLFVNNGNAGADNVIVYVQISSHG